MTSEIVCYFDGCCEPKNPGGNMGIGAVVFKDKEEIGFASYMVPAKYENSSNVAEYMAFNWVLRFLIHEGYENDKVTVFGDSSLVVHQMNFEWKIKNGLYVNHAEEAMGLRMQFSDLTIKLIFRTENNYADLLSKDELIKKGVEFKIQPLK